MEKLAKHKIVIMGCGNVAWHLAKQFHALKSYDLFIYNHRPNSALNDFKSKLKCKVFENLNAIIPDADFYFICVADKYISAVSGSIKNLGDNSVIVHTSGSTPLKDINSNHPHKGVFYPLQTFTKKDEVLWTEVPVIIEANTRMSENRLVALAKHFSRSVMVLEAKERLRLHLAAVLVNNFTNALYVAASELILKNSKNSKFDMLLPLIRQTTKKIEYLHPLEAQTGPARRRDAAVIEKHIKLLSKEKNLKKIYKEFTNLIVKQQTTHA